MTSATPLTAEAFSARLLAIDDEGTRCALIERTPFDREVAAAASQRLLDEAERLISIDPHRMEAVCIDALAVAERHDLPYFQAMARFKRGEACTLQGRNAEARTYLDEADAAFSRLGCLVESARTRIIWIWATANLGGDAEAMRAVRRARRVLDPQSQPLHRATLDLHTGILHCMHGRYHIGIRQFRSALTLYQSLGLEERAERARHNLGLALSRLGRYEQAIAALLQSRDAARRWGHGRTDAVRTRAIGETHARLGRYAAALRSFEEAKALYDDLSLHDGSVQIRLDIADCYLRLNRPAEALTALDDVDHYQVHVDEAIQVVEIATRRIVAHLLLEQESAAMEIVEGTAGITSPGFVEARIWLGAQRAALFLRKNLPHECLAECRQIVAAARQAGLTPWVADAQILEGWAFLTLGNVQAAAHAAARAYREARRQDAAPLLHRSLELRGRIAEARDQRAVARKNYVAAIEQFEREQRGVIFEFRDAFAIHRTTAYERLVAVYLDEGRTQDALATAERAKSRALGELIAGSIVLRPRGTSATRRITRDLMTARQEYAASYARSIGDDATTTAESTADARRHLSQLEGRINALTQQLQVHAAAEQIADVYGATPQFVTPALPSDTALIEYFFVGDNLARFVIDRGGVQCTMLDAGVPAIDRLLRTLRLNLQSAAGADHETQHHLIQQAKLVLSRLYSHLFDGVDAAAGYRSLVIVPHGLLHYVPFHALYNDEQYLIERCAISYAPSAYLYTMCRRRKRHRRDGPALVLANTFDGRLPHVLREAESVGSALGATIYRESEATRATLAREGRRASVIHVAAHGEFRPDAPLFSHIQLADGPLTTADVFDLNLRADLVTLSACDTGQTNVGGGDELVGLSRAFLYAGAATLLVSQWRVDDLSTAEQMTHFYRVLQQGSDPAEALRITQINFLKNAMPQSGHAHPFLWAGFQLIGAT